MALVESAGGAWATGAANVATTGSFTPAAGDLLVACAAIGNGSNAATTGLAVTDSLSGSWTQLGTTAILATGPMCGVWVQDAGASPSARTVTATGTSSSVVNTGLVVRRFAGAAPAAGQS